jgi:ABC-type branched-subunit amino acid transport system substrate-binding protein
MRVTLLILAFLLAATVAWGQDKYADEAQDVAMSSGEETDKETEEGEHYGGARADLLPFAGMKKYYKTFFRDPTIYLGPGRKIPEVKAEDLESVKIGLIAPIYNGAMDQYVGEMALRGIQMAIDEVNEKGGFRGKIPYELIARNDMGLWGSSSNTAVELCWDEKVWAIMGSVHGANTHIQLRVVLKAEVMMVNSSDTDPTLNETNIPWLLRTYPDDRQYCYRLAWHIFKEKGYKRVAVLRANDKYGRMGIAEFRDTARRLGYPLILEVRYSTMDINEDYKAQVERIRKCNPDAIVLWGCGCGMGKATKVIREMGLTQPVYTSERAISQLFLDHAGEAANGVVAPFPLDLTRTDEVWTTFRDNFRERYDLDPDGFASFSYDAAMMIVEAIEEVGLQRAWIRDYLCDLREWEGVSGPMYLDAKHDNLGTMYMYRIENGKFVKLEDK